MHTQSILRGANHRFGTLPGGHKPCNPAARNLRLVVQAAKNEKQGGRQPWDIGRFAQTVMFFNEPPKPEEVLQALVQQPAKILGAIFGGGTEEKKTAVMTLLARNPSPSTPAAGAKQSGVVLVTGATGGVGKRVVGVLLAQGRRVRALVRDVEKAKELLSPLPLAPGAQLEIAAADITQRKTLTPEMFSGVAQVISCTAVKVQPKEGDTADRAKYYQGIKFFDPEIVGDTPETVEYVGLRNVMDAVAQQLGQEAGQVLLSADGSLVSTWGALDDVVMGGVSQSGISLVQGAGEGGAAAAVFRGLVSTDNSGGFASVRCKNFSPLLDLSPYEGISMRLKGNGLRFKMIIRTDANWDGIGYCKSFDTQAGVWQTIHLPFADFTPVFRARSVKGGAPLNPSSIASIQLMLSKFEYDGQLNPAFKDGPFELPIMDIRAYMKEPVTPRFVHVSSAGVTRPNRPGINVDQEPPAVKLNDALGGLLTYKLAGEDVVRGSGVPYAIVRPCALTEEPLGAPVELDQGDVIKGKIAREEVADLCVSLLSQPSGTGTTFEIKSTIPFSQPWQVDPAAPPPPKDWSTVLGGAGLQRGVTGKTVDGVYTGKQPEAEAAAAAAATAARKVPAA